MKYILKRFDYSVTSRNSGKLLLNTNDYWKARNFSTKNNCKLNCRSKFDGTVAI